MILTTITGLHYPDQIDQTRADRHYKVVGVHSVIENGRCVKTIYTVKNEDGRYRDMTDTELYEFFKDQTE